MQNNYKQIKLTMSGEEGTEFDGFESSEVIDI